jgi:hypothetical protein
MMKVYLLLLISIHLLLVSRLVAACWDEIESRTLRLSWRKILPEGASASTSGATSDATEQNATQESTDEYSVEEFNSMFEMLGHRLTEEEVREWLCSDEHDMGYAHLSDSEIVSNVMRDQDHEESDDSDDNEVPEETSFISHVSALMAVFVGYSSKKKLVYNVQALQELRELAARKRVSAIKQRKRTDFFA